MSENCAVVTERKVSVSPQLMRVLLILFCLGTSCCPYYRGFLTSEVSARLFLAVTSDVRKVKNKRFTVLIKNREYFDLILTGRLCTDYQLQ